ncbi:MAG: ParA family protein [Acidimicrobiia bacterium]|nr:ParA family protein [Acidimicrobiia bacterium]
MHNVIAFANGKGGVGKTSLTANFAGLAAASGWRVLAVDLDPQGNLGADLGYDRTDQGDDGRELIEAIIHQRRPRPIQAVRTNLDVVAGGAALDQFVERVARDATSNRLQAVRRPLSALANDYDLVVLDCPPTGGIVLQTMLAAAAFVVVPTRRDLASMQGLTRVAREFAAVRSTVNPDLRLLGVVLFEFAAQDTRLLAETRGMLEERLSSIAPVFEGFVRQARRASSEMRRLGMLAHEYDEATRAPGARRLAGSVVGLAADYRQITEAILEEYGRRTVPVAADPWSAA